jgi:ParB/RepB/Spo0J family partition protein
LIPVELLIPTPDNPRFLPDPLAMEKLCASIKSQGILQPVVCRPHPRKAGSFDMRAGSRRVQAARLLGLKDVPAIVREMSDADAMEITVAENFARKDLHPLEEARGIQAMLDLGWSIEDVALRLGHPAAWVARRAVLTRLIEPWRKSFIDDRKDWPAGIMLSVARLPEAMQNTVLQEIKSRYARYAPQSTREFDQWLNDSLLRELSAAPWKLDDAMLLPKAGACKECQSRSSCQPMLFEEDRGKRGAAKDRCLNATCYTLKLQRTVQARIAAAEKKLGCKVSILTGDAGGEQAKVIKKAYGREGVSRWTGDRVKPETKGAVPAIDPETAQVAWIRPFSVGSRKERPKGKDGKPKPIPLRERREELQRRRDAWVVDDVQKRLIELATNDKTPLPELAPLNVLAWAATFGTHTHEPGADATDWKRLGEMSPGKAAAILLRRICGVWSDRLNHFTNKDIHVHLYEAQQVCRLLNWDLAALKTHAEAEIPEPASWARLNEDGTPKGVASGKTKAAKKGKQ